MCLFVLSAVRFDALCTCASLRRSYLMRIICTAHRHTSVCATTTTTTTEKKRNRISNTNNTIKNSSRPQKVLRGHWCQLYVNYLYAMVCACKCVCSHFIIMCSLSLFNSISHALKYMRASVCDVRACVCVMDREQRG